MRRPKSVPILHWLLHRRRGSWVAGLAGLFLLFLDRQGVNEPLTRHSFDLPQAWRPGVRVEDFLIVRMDEGAGERLGQLRHGPWDRHLHARLLDRLREAGARLVVFDLFLYGTNRIAGGDAALADALRRCGEARLPVVFGSNYNLEGDPSPAWIEFPSPAFVPADAQPDWLGQGTVELGFDPDDVVRRVRGWREAEVREPAGFWARTLPGSVAAGNPPVFEVPALAWEAARRAGGAADARRAAPALWMRYYGRPGGQAFAEAAFDAILEGRVPAGQIQGRVILVGGSPKLGYTDAGKDVFRHPFGGVVSGIELQATLVANLLRGDWLYRLPFPLEILLLVGVAVASGRLFSRLAPMPGIGAMVLGGMLFTAFGVLLAWYLRVWFSWLIIAAVQLPAAYLWSLLVHSIEAEVQTRTLRSSIIKVLPAPIVEALVRHPELAAPGGWRREISILFSDISGFSRLAERQMPADVVRLLNAYFDRALAAIHQRGGVVLDLKGDAILAAWNPLQQVPDPDHALGACLAAVELGRTLEKFEREGSGLPLPTRIGVHCGEVVVGNIGSSDRFAFTAIGDAVNLASRLENLNKLLGTRVLASRAIQSAAETQVHSRRVGYFRLVGFDKVTEVHELLIEENALPAPWGERFAAGLQHFVRRRFDDAEREFRAVLELRPGDGPSRYYVEKAIPLLRGMELPSQWAGEITLGDK